VEAAASPLGGGVARRDVARGETATGSAERVTVPFRLKFCRSRGPTASVAGAELGAAWVVAASWASAANGVSASPTAKTAPTKRKTALINSRFLLVNRAILRAKAHASQSATIQAWR